MAKVTGVGGVFFKSKGDVGALAAWYREHFGLPLEDWGGAVLKWPEDQAEDALGREEQSVKTVRAPVARSTRRFMTTGIAAACLAVALATSLPADPPSAAVSDEQAIRQLKLVDWPRAYREQNVQLLDRILADEFERIGFNGERSSKKEELAHVKATPTSYDTFSFEITRLSVFENGTAIVSGIGTITGKDSEGRYTTTYSSSNTLLKRGGQWRAVGSHVSGIKTERGAARP